MKYTFYDAVNKKFYYGKCMDCGKILWGSRQKRCRPCMGRNNAVPIDQRFWKYVDKTDKCWLWTGSKNVGGYGHILANGKLVSAHRLSYVLHTGRIPKALSVLHRCDVRACVNPAHLFLGTYRDNILDAIKKGRVKIPLRKPRLPIKDMLYIQNNYRFCKNGPELAKRFKISRQTLYNIIKRKLPIPLV